MPKAKLPSIINKRREEVPYYCRGYKQAPFTFRSSHFRNRCSGDIAYEKRNTKNPWFVSLDNVQNGTRSRQDFEYIDNVKEIQQYQYQKKIQIGDVKGVGKFGPTLRIEGNPKRVQVRKSKNIIENRQAGQGVNMSRTSEIASLDMVVSGNLAEEMTRDEMDNETIFDDNRYPLNDSIIQSLLRFGRTIELKKRRRIYGIEARRFHFPLCIQRFCDAFPNEGVWTVHEEFNLKINWCPEFCFERFEELKSLTLMKSDLSEKSRFFRDNAILIAECDVGIVFTLRMSLQGEPLRDDADDFVVYVATYDSELEDAKRAGMRVNEPFMLSTLISGMRLARVQEIPILEPISP